MVFLNLKKLNRLIDCKYINDYTLINFNKKSFMKQCFYS